MNNLISFYPGPSKVYHQVKQYMQEALHENILSLNHRSLAFMDLYKETVKNLKAKLAIPEDYTIFFASSATECWEMVTQSFLQAGEAVLHVYRGAFGEKWADYTEKLSKYAQKETYVWRNNTDTLALPTNATLACFTPSETSNGTFIEYSVLQAYIQQTLPAFTAFDVTSSFGGIHLPFELGDFWFASVQKCLGLPSGMAVCVVSPRAVDRIYEINERSHYNSLAYVLDNAKNYQTTHTPNILNIYLLNKVMQQVLPIAETEKMLRERAKDWYAFLEQFPTYSLPSPETRSPTVICVGNTPEKITYIKETMQARGIILGNGYGAGKANSFRIANFPALEEEEINLCKEILKTVL